MLRHRLVQKRHRFLVPAEDRKQCLRVTGLHTQQIQDMLLLKGALPVVYRLEFARHVVLGCDILVVTTDHKPLIGVFNNWHLGDIKNGRPLSPRRRRCHTAFYHPNTRTETKVAGCKLTETNW